MSEMRMEQPKETEDFLHNPGMGIMYLQREKNKIRYDEVPSKSWFLKEKLTDKISVNLVWSVLESKEGEYNWGHSDWEGCFNSWIANGYKVALLVRGMGSRGTLYNDGTPQWVFNAGAEYIDESPEYFKYIAGSYKHYLQPEDDRAYRFPVYWDPIYLEKVNNFVRALGKRYNGNPNIEYVIIGHMGRCGEMHISCHSPVKHWLDKGYSLAKYIEAHKKIIDMYVDAFPNTPLVQQLSDPAYGLNTIKQAEEIIDYLVSKGVYLKNDGFGKSWEGDVKNPYLSDWVIEYFDKYYPKVKVMFENIVFPEAMKSMLKYHISYWHTGREVDGLQIMRVGDPQKTLYSWLSFYKEQYAKMTVEDEKNIFRYMARYVGYRFVLKELIHPSKIKKGETFSVKYKWKNKGSSPCYKNYAMLLTLANKNGNIIWENIQLPNVPTSSLKLDSNCIVNDELKWEIPMNSKIQNGIYDLYIGIRDIKNSDIKIELAIGNKDNQKRYKIGRIEIIS